MSTLEGWSHFKSWVRSVLLHPGKHPRQVLAGKVSAWALCAPQRTGKHHSAAQHWPVKGRRHIYSTAELIHCHIPPMHCGISWLPLCACEVWRNGILWDRFIPFWQGKHIEQSVSQSLWLSQGLFTLFSCCLPWKVLQVAPHRCLWQWQMRSFFTVLIGNEPCICLLLNMNLNSRINNSSNWNTHLCMILFQSWSC